MKRARAVGGWAVMLAVGMMAAGSGCGAASAAGAGSETTATATATTASATSHGARWQDGNWFAARARETLDQIGARIRADVDRELLAADALADHATRRRDLDAALDRAASDGWTNLGERDWVRQRMEEASRAPGRYARGGGGERAAEYRYDDAWWR